MFVYELNRCGFESRCSYKFFDKSSCANTSGGAVTHALSETLATQDKSAFKNEIVLTQQLTNKLHKPIVTKLEKQKVHSFFIYNIWGADLADIQLISKFDKKICFLLCVIDIFSKYAQVVSLKDKKRIIITNAFQEILDEANHKPRR